MENVSCIHCKKTCSIEQMIKCTFCGNWGCDPKSKCDGIKVLSDTVICSVCLDDDPDKLLDFLVIAIGNPCLDQKN